MFRLYPVLTAAALTAMAVLVALGTWQIQRRAAKHAFLDKVAARAAEQPVPLEQVLSSPDPEYRRVQIAMPTDCQRQALVNGFIVEGGRTIPGATVITPGLLPNGDAVLVARGFVPNAILKGQSDWRQSTDCPDQLQGIAVWAPPQSAGTFTPPANLSEPRWYHWDGVGMARHLGLKLKTAAILRMEPESPVRPAWPRPQAYALNIPNNHLVYALTWYGLALTLFGVYIAFHWSRGRIGRT
ncbi:MAG TPA: hypothetical protein DCL54_16150 [Alphaproteobacteria bacterium]|nr:hypothetical protein [Alphaproteobacteria bacterium]HAJ48105.1 hypothetical protein [Alphaproteobacteria bacterium]